MVELELFEISRINSIRVIHLFGCLTGAVFLLIIWNDGRKRVDTIGNDLGAIFVAFALLLWSAMDLYRLLGLMVPGEVSVVLKTFSAYNNAFFIAALPYFRYVYRGLKAKYLLFANGRNWALAVVLVNILIVMFYTISWGENEKYSWLVKNFDVLYSIATFGGTGYAIAKTFLRQRNQRKVMSIIATVTTLLLILPQIFFASIFEIKHFDVLSLILLCSQNVLICLLIVIANDWTNEITGDKEREVLLKIKEDLSIRNNEIKELKAQLSSKTESLNVLTLEMKENAKKLEQGINKSKLAELSERELEVLGKINKSYNEIANELFIAKDTVITHKKNIEAKLNISGKENLAEFAKECGILES